MDVLPLALSVALAGPFGAVSPPGLSFTVGEPSGRVSTPDPTTAVVRTVEDPDVPGADRGTSRRWAAPVTPLRVVRAFDAPARRWLPGHRGVDVRAPTGTAVLASADGRIAFSGMVAGRPVVSIDHLDATGSPIRTTYEPVTASLAPGATVRRGEAVGTVADDSHCPGGCLHWGARRGEDYVDPMSFLRGRVRLWTPLQRG